MRLWCGLPGANGASNGPDSRTRQDNDDKPTTDADGGLPPAVASAVQGCRRDGEFALRSLRATGGPATDRRNSPPLPSSLINAPYSRGVPTTAGVVLVPRWVSALIVRRGLPRSAARRGWPPRQLPGGPPRCRGGGLWCAAAGRAVPAPAGAPARLWRRGWSQGEGRRLTAAAPRGRSWSRRGDGR